MILTTLVMFRFLAGAGGAGAGGAVPDFPYLAGVTLLRVGGLKRA